MLSTAVRAQRVDYLRLSITDRCNLRCTYCMPAEGVPAREHDDILSYEELAAFTRVAAAAGISKVRITGGEPLVRKGCAGLIAQLAAIPGVDDISLTTNGVLLPRFAAELRAAGLRRVNISIDSLDSARYRRITRGGELAGALAGIDAALVAGFAPVKINALLLRGIEDELDSFVSLTRARPLHVRFIEYMPLDRRLGSQRLESQEQFVSAGEVLARLRVANVLEPVAGPYGNGPARYWRVAGGEGTIGFIAGVSDHFCSSCNRLRLTADGRLRSCLFAGDEVNIRPLIARPADLLAALTVAVSDKNYDRCLEAGANERVMSQIGG